MKFHMIFVLSFIAVLVGRKTIEPIAPENGMETLFGL